MAFNRKAKLRDNIEAIRTVFTLEKEGRTATPAEREVLERYCGFGGLKCILNPAGELTDAVHWAKSDLDLFPLTVELHRLIRENSKDERQYKRYVSSLKNSVLTAFYTPREVTEGIAKALVNYKVEARFLLEPSAGQGAFMDAYRKFYPQTDMTAFEKDLLTGKILTQLYPECKVRTEGFEKMEKYFNGHFDVALSNIPFGDIAVFDPDFSNSKSAERRTASKSIHNYFFLKGLDAVRDGGIVAFITSQGVVNSRRNENVLREMFRHADLVSALRLPNNLFTDGAGTEVGSDLIVLQKNGDKGDMSVDEDLLCGGYLSDKGVTVNEYFREYPDRIICTQQKMGTDPYGKPAMEYLHEGGVQGIADDVYEKLGMDCNARLDIIRYLAEIIRQRKTAVPHTEKIQERTAPENTIPAKDERLPEEMTAETAAITGTIPVTEDKEREKEKPAMPVEGGLFAFTTTDAKKEKEEAEPTAAPLLTLYDLFGFTQAERREAQQGIKKKKSPQRKGKTAPMQKNLFSDAKPQGTKDAKDAQTAKDTAKQPETTSPQHTSQRKNPAASTAEDTVQAAERTAAQMSAQTINTDPEEVYAAINWETNPPINGFYETMMSLTSERREELRQKAGLHREMKTAKTQTTGTTDATNVTADNNGGKMSRNGTSNGNGVSNDNEWVYPVENAPAEDLKRRAQEVEQEMRAEEAALTKEERQRRHEQEMQPRPYSRPVDAHLKEGSLVWEYTAGVRYQVGVLKRVTPLGATFQPLDLDSVQKEKAQQYIRLRDAYQRLYANEAEKQEEDKEWREHLNTHYDEFVMRYGNLNAKQNVKLVLMDAAGRDTLSLEREEEGKIVRADIFDHPVSFATEETTHVGTATEALALSLNRTGEVDPDYMQSLTGTDREELTEELKGRIYYNPLKDHYEIKDRFIAGNVVQKAENISRWLAANEEEGESHPMKAAAEASLAALHEAQSRPISFEELDFNFGYVKKMIM